MPISMPLVVLSAGNTARIGFHVGRGAGLVAPERDLVEHAGQQGATPHAAKAVGVDGYEHAAAQANLDAA